MKKYFRPILSILPGALYAALIALLSQLLIRFLAELFGLFSGTTGLNADTLDYITQILRQFRSASLVSPWLPFLLTGAILGAPIVCLIHRRRGRIIAAAVLSVILLLPLTLLALWFTEVNGIKTCALVRTLLPLLPSLL